MKAWWVVSVYSVGSLGARFTGGFRMWRLHADEGDGRKDSPGTGKFPRGD